eukprot:TRINITY_DN44173_c0_g1_i1.p1 TRINITY_DN44173_c0_g1~~TRINITY_DN44173_c0_g1_i1.p1  ORF type:complete len:153 (+),score=53.66 TRINITY_DN44173_c0_g1_i1:61-519(+)
MPRRAALLLFAAAAAANTEVDNILSARTDNYTHTIIVNVLGGLLLAGVIAFLVLSSKRLLSLAKQERAEMHEKMDRDEDLSRRASVFTIGRRPTQSHLSRLSLPASELRTERDEDAPREEPGQMIKTAQDVPPTSNPLDGAAAAEDIDVGQV